MADSNSIFFSSLTLKANIFFNKISIILLNRDKKKELIRFQNALNDFNSAFLNKYQFKYGYVMPSVMAQIDAEVMKRLIKLNNSDDHLKEIITIKGVVYLLVYKTCISLSNSYMNSGTEFPSSVSETLLDYIKFSLEGLNHEKLKGN